MTDTAGTQSACPAISTALEQRRQWLAEQKAAATTKQKHLEQQAQTLGDLEQQIGELIDGLPAITQAYETELPNLQKAYDKLAGFYEHESQCLMNLVGHLHGDMKAIRAEEQKRVADLAAQVGQIAGTTTGALPDAESALAQAEQTVEQCSSELEGLKTYAETLKAQFAELTAVQEEIDRVKNDEPAEAFYLLHWPFGPWLGRAKVLTVMELCSAINDKWEELRAAREARNTMEKERDDKQAELEGKQTEYEQAQAELEEAIRARIRGLSTTPPQPPAQATP